MRATNSSKGMLKKELLASHVSAKASKGAIHIKALVTKNANAEDLNFKMPCKGNGVLFSQTVKYDVNGDNDIILVVTVVTGMEA